MYRYFSLINYAIILLFVISLLVGCANLLNDDKKEFSYKIIGQTSITEDPGYYKIENSYPYFVSDDTILNKKLDVLNRQIEGYLDTAAQYFWGVNFDEVRKIKDETQASGLFELKNTYQVFDSTPDFISIKMETYSYALGAHGFTAISVFNFLTDEMKFLQLTDLLDLSMPENINLLNHLLEKNFENPGDCFDQQPTAGKDFRLFAIEKENLVFFYEAYELGAYYCGQGKVSIPLEELKEAGLWKWDFRQITEKQTDE
jgi:hypothetical protein